MSTRTLLVYLFVAACTAVGPLPAKAQTIRPLVSEYQSMARGRLELVNESDRPLTVVVEPKGYVLDQNGEVHDEPLAAHIHVRLSAMSFRIPPRQSRLVFYEATADRTPAWFVLYANFTGYPRAEHNGLDVQLELPHFVYILPKDHWKAEDIRVRDVAVQHDSGKLVLFVENTGPQFGRIDAIDVVGAGRKISARGFPLFPGSRRRIEIDWPAAAEPDDIAVKSKDFSVQHTLTHVAGDVR